MLIVSLICTFVHETMCHEEGTDNALLPFSHAGPEHRHDGQVLDDHDHPQHSEHDSDHHDEDSHDHQFRVLITKKDPTTHFEVLASHVKMIPSFVSGSDQSVNLLNRSHYIFHRDKPAPPDYLCAHVLLL